MRGAAMHVEDGAFREPQAAVKRLVWQGERTTPGRKARLVQSERSGSRPQLNDLQQGSMWKETGWPDGASANVAL